ncbi:hypothetical protein OGAPHI_001341 [Ogataea philodendri]|uniref:Uncharacterized protein n=1 Tax=Ogataea philodendri TaxID=1378263 RepID=A0A9P8PCS8_9ASCO|nr:uncharacterized protein OGAPHI_001341 [Ogataea philodendri]KAH3669220.1 hypothetical protein OGAPHI_001341 [Ogataea philodendri]
MTTAVETNAPGRIPFQTLSHPKANPTASSIKISECLILEPVKGAKAATSAMAIWLSPTTTPIIRYARHNPTGPVLARVPPLLRNRPVPNTPTSAIIPICLSFNAFSSLVSSSRKIDPAVNSSSLILTVSRALVCFFSNSGETAVLKDMLILHPVRFLGLLYTLWQRPIPWHPSQIFHATTDRNY